MESLHNLLNMIAGSAILVFEFVGVIIIIIAGLKGIYGFFVKDPMMRLKLAQGMAMGLEFKLGGEILRTVIVRELSEFLTVAGIIILRAALTFLTHWEIRNEESQTHKNK